jgi:hypothetical protein
MAPASALAALGMASHGACARARRRRRHPRSAQAPTRTCRNTAPRVTAAARSQPVRRATQAARAATYREVAACAWRGISWTLPPAAPGSARQSRQLRTGRSASSAGTARATVKWSVRTVTLVPPSSTRAGQMESGSRHRAELCRAPRSRVPQNRRPGLSTQRAVLPGVTQTGLAA